jgi:hypothetical protein
MRGRKTDAEALDARGRLKSSVDYGVKGEIRGIKAL